MIESLDIESWERLASVASAEHEQNLVRRNELTRRRSLAALNALVNGDTDAVAGIDDELCAVEARICGHAEVRRMVQRGLDAATVIASADSELAQIAMTRAAAQRRAELAHQVDDALESLATVLTAYLDSNESAQRPDRTQGNIRRAFHHWFGKAGYRGRPTWWRQAVVGMSEPTPVAQVAPLSSTVDPMLAESDTLEAAALKRRTEAVAALESLTLTKPVPSTKTRSNRKIDALSEAA